ncbi:MAG: nucleotidyltransferase domain-containing protein [Patescibacteria group bacterium]
MTKQLQQEIDKIVHEIVTKYQPEKVILFGSAARGDVTEDSDFDFFIIKSNVPHLGRDRYYDLMKVIEYHHASDFLICTPQEVSARLAMGDPFISSIMTEGRVLHG